MEFRVFPRGYTLLRVRQPLPDGQLHLQEQVQLVFLDVSGIPTVCLFTAEAWQEFQAFVADPEGEAARQRARESILGPGGMAPSLKKKH